MTSAHLKSRVKLMWVTTWAPLRTESGEEDVENDDEDCGEDGKPEDCAVGDNDVGVCPATGNGT